MTSEEHNRIVAAGLSKFSFMKQDEPTAADKLVAEAQRITNEVKDHIQPVMLAGGRRDPDSLRALMSKLYVERFARLSKDELEMLCTILHVEIAFEQMDIL